MGRLTWLLIAIAAAIALAGGCSSKPPCCGATETCACFDPENGNLGSCDCRCLTLRNKRGELRCLGPVR
jgi:hypothetical protein